MEDGAHGVHLDLAVRPVGLVTRCVIDSAQIQNLRMEESLALDYHQRGKPVMRMPVQVRSTRYTSCRSVKAPYTRSLIHG